MLDEVQIKTYTYSGILAPICESFIQEKRAVGYLYNSEAKKLSEFSRFTLAFKCPPDALPKEIVQAWIAKKPTDSERNQYARFSLICQFAQYMQRMGYPAYIPAASEVGRYRKNYVPYIFSHEEIQAFFQAADSMTRLRYSMAPRRHLIMPVLFRVLYCCGLRANEALKLKGEDVDLQQGILTIRNSKNGKTRYVPMSAELTKVCADYDKTRLVGPPGSNWFLLLRMGAAMISVRFMIHFARYCGKLESLTADVAKGLVFMIFGTHSAYTVWSAGLPLAQILQHLFPA